MATIREVARASGVSTATVSHVVNGKDEKVSSETRDRVLSAVRELQYRPPAMEDRQRSVASQTLGVVIPDIASGSFRRKDYGAELMYSIIGASLDQGWSATIFAERVWREGGQSIRRAYDGRCDGVVVLAPSQSSPLVASLVERGVPTVLVGTTASGKGLSSVDVDNFAIGAEAAERLHAAGHDSFIYIGQPSSTCSSAERGQSFHATLLKLGVSPSRIASHQCGGGDIDGAFMRRTFGAGGSAPTGIFCWNDDFARRVVRRLEEENLLVPSHVSVLGVDDDPPAVSETPHFSTFRQPLAEIGVRAVELLVARVADHALLDEAVRLPAEFVDRGSVQAPRLPS